MAIDHDKLDIEKLRTSALKTLKVKAPSLRPKFSESAMLKTIHELEVYRIELNMVQEELERADEQIEDLTRKYDDLSELHSKFIHQIIREKRHFGE